MEVHCFSRLKTEMLNHLLKEAYLYSKQLDYLSYTRYTFVKQIKNKVNFDLT